MSPRIMLVHCVKIITAILRRSDRKTTRISKYKVESNINITKINHNQENWEKFEVGFIDVGQAIQVFIHMNVRTCRNSRGGLMLVFLTRLKLIAHNLNMDFIC
jgi:hypothetical protein